LLFFCLLFFCAMANVLVSLVLDRRARAGGEDGASRR